ncbi:MAG: hypothetical protein WAM26_14860 [Nitrososphaeraceae archaeon]
MSNTASEDNNLFDGLVVSESYHNQYSASNQCSGKGCTKIAKNLLMISYINKRGYFCDECACDLLIKQLAIRLSPPS